MSRRLARVWPARTGSEKFSEERGGRAHARMVCAAVHTLMPQYDAQPAEEWYI